jgi:hypothetical protein
MSRELVRASSFPVLRERGSAAERPSVGVHRDIKTPRKGLHRKADPTSKKIAEKCRYDATSRMAKARRTNVRQS